LNNKLDLILKVAGAVAVFAIGAVLVALLK